jgi:CAAX protease family protein
MSFTWRLTRAIIAGLIAAVIVSPFAAWAIAHAGLRFPFPRIFDRTVMVTVALAILYEARALRLAALLGAGFAAPASNLARAARGFIVALAVIAALLTVAALFGATRAGHFAHALALLPKYLLSAIVIAIIEEAFFRALLFGGMTSDFGRTAALIASSVIYALAHLVRSPAHFYVTGLDLTAGLRTLAGSTAQLSHPATALPTLAGLFLLGVVLAAAFIETGTVYFSMGLHAGFVVGVKLWPKLIAEHAALPGWLAGWGHQPLISGAAAWVLAIMVLLMLKPLAGRRRS